MEFIDQNDNSINSDKFNKNNEIQNLDNNNLRTDKFDDYKKELFEFINPSKPYKQILIFHSAGTGMRANF